MVPELQDEKGAQNTKPNPETLNHYSPAVFAFVALLTTPQVRDPYGREHLDAVKKSDRLSFTGCFVKGFNLSYHSKGAEILTIDP